MKKKKLTILERTHIFISRKKVASKEELEEFAEKELGKDYDYLYRKFIYNLIGQGKVERIKNGIYYARNIFSEEETPPDKYLIASKIRPSYYLGYHTALELLGCAQSVDNNCYICVDLKGRFKPFAYGNARFIPSIVNDLTTEVVQRKVGSSEVMTSSPSRTFVECVQRPDLCIGYEEVYKSLESMVGVNIDGLLLVLDLYGKRSLYRSVGFFLEELKNGSPYYSHIEDRDLKRIHERTGNGRSYLVKGTKGEFVKRWNLYIPRGFRDLFLGVR